MCEYIILEDFKMDKYIYDENNGLWYERNSDYYFPMLYPPKKASLSAYGGSVTNAIYRNTKERFIPVCSQVVN